MRKNLRLITFLVICITWISYARADTSLETKPEQETFNTEPWKPYDGLPIREIQVHGLKWTKERAVLMLLSQHRGDIFASAIWLKGIHKLYNTTVLYDIRTEIRPTIDHQIDIDLWITDRWTLLPYGIAQGGGGSTDLGLGIWDANAFGYFTQISASYNQFDQVDSYDLNLYQEFILDTQFMGGADLSTTGTPVSLQANNGSSLGSFTWERHQQQVLLGTRLEPNIRLFAYAETYQDQIVNKAQAPDVYVYSGTQYRFRPTLIIGRSNLTNFLEQGYELTLAPTTANFASVHERYAQWVTTYKRTFIDGNTNYAVFLNGGAMTSAPIPYLFRLGGYDTVRGFSTNRALGRYYLNYNLEYRPYLARMHFPLVGEVILQGSLFQDMAQMWNSSDLESTHRVNSSIFLLSNGAGVRFNFQKFSQAILRIDVARTTFPDEGWGGGFGVGEFF